jgi:uncharacterized membrane protein YqjE
MEMLLQKEEQMKHLKTAAILLAPFAIMYLLFGFVFWNWDAKSWDAMGLFLYVVLVVPLVIGATAFVEGMK